MRRLKLEVFLAGLLAVAAPAGTALAGTDDIRFAADLSPDEESIATYSKATGHAEVILERETLKVSWKVTFKDLSGPLTQAGLFGPDNAGGNAGLAVDIGGKNQKSPIEGSTVLTDGQFQYLITGRMYVNILTAKWNGGELRGQLRRKRKPLSNVTQ